MSYQVQIFIYFRSIINLFVTIALLLHFHDKSLLSLTLHYYSETQEWCLIINNNKKYINIIDSSGNWSLWVRNGRQTSGARQALDYVAPQFGL